MFKDKKGLTWQQLILAIIALVVVVLVIWWFQKGGSKGYGSLSEKIDDLGDCDEDKVANLFDKCPCDAGSPGADLNGCSISTKEGDPPTKEKVGVNCCKTG